MSLQTVNIDPAYQDSAVVHIAHDPIIYGRFVANLVKDMGSPTADILHAAVGISGEAGELLDAVKKHWAYGKPLDGANVIEELGDLEFYMAALRMCIGVTRQQVLDSNAAKLQARYLGGTYSDAAAIARADKAATGETEASGVYERTLAQQKKVIAINLTKEQVAAVDETAGFTTAILTQPPVEPPQTPMVAPTDSPQVPPLP